MINAVFALAFGPPVARLFPGFRGALIFLAYYIACGLAGTLGYGLVHLDSAVPLVGASGAVTGLLGGAVRLLGAGGAVLPLTDRRVIGMSVVILLTNAASGLIGLSAGVMGAQIAWEAHGFGFVAGLLLIGPAARWFGRSDRGFDSPAALRDPSN